MSFDSYAVVKIKDSEPEVFWVMLRDSLMSRNGPSMQSSGDLDETGVREHLAKMGLSDTKIEELIARARANPQ